MNKTKLLGCLLTAGVLFGSANHALAVPLSTLTAGGTIVSGDVTFDNFNFEDIQGVFGPVAVNPDLIDVTVSSTATSVSLMFAGDGGDPLVELGEEDVFEIRGGDPAGPDRGFSVLVAAGSSRVLSQVTFELDGQVFDGDFPSFVELGSNTLMDSVTIDQGTPSPVSFFSTLADLTAYDVDWDLQGETSEGSDAEVIVNSFTVTFGLRDVGPPQPAPDTATISLMLSGLVGIGLLGMRRRKKR